jgi:hypothetical protein
VLPNVLVHVAVVPAGQHDNAVSWIEVIPRIERSSVGLEYVETAVTELARPAEKL